MFRKLLKKSERGQAIVLIAFAMVGLIAFVGLMVDGGMLLIEYAKLKRAIDSASIASAAQFRKGFSGADLASAAQEFLIFNQTAADSIEVFTCHADPDNPIANTTHDPALCTTPLRKLIRITATRTINFGFMPVVGITGTTISASSVGEAASLDLVLIIDTSASMAYETSGDPASSDPGDDPALCNATETCEPLESVKAVALDFMDTMFFPYDRVGIITMTSQIDNGFRDPYPLLNLSSDEDAVKAAIGDIRVYQPPSCPSVYGPCRDLCTLAEITGPDPGPCAGQAEGYYVGEDCPAFRIYGDRSSCTSSNVGGSFIYASDEFSREPIREDSFWVVIALVGGPANASTGTGDLTDSDGNGYPDDPFAFGYCPQNTWNSSVNPPCRDSDEDTRHDPDELDGTGSFSVYDADDFARDKADFLADPVDGMGVTIFTIGMGQAGTGLLVNTPKSNPVNAGELLLEYIAEEAGGTTANHGFYAFSPDTAGLADIFSKIAENIFTRISQ